jgi:hypothetical protein
VESIELPFSGFWIADFGIKASQAAGPFPPLETPTSIIQNRASKIQIRET